MDNDVVMWWWQRGEFAEQRGDWQTGASVDQPGSDLLQDDSSISAMQKAPLGEPPTAFDVRCTYDSRPVNGYDFNYSLAVALIDGGSSSAWTAEFNVPNGYRAVPRKWTIEYQPELGVYGGPDPVSSYIATIVSILQNSAALPNNQNIIVGPIPDGELETFFVCEENTTFGISGFCDYYLSTDPTYAIVNVYGNLIPVSDVSLPLAIANQRLPS